MLNILPKEEKRGIITEYRLRVATVAMFLITAVVLASLVLLVPSYLLVNTKYDNITSKISAEQIRDGVDAQEKEVDAQVNDINKKIDFFQGTSGAAHLSIPEVIAKIIGMKGPAVKIVGFSYDATDRQERLVISGIAADRDELAAFAETLKGSNIFTAVDLPVSSYVKSSNIDFAIVATRTLVTAPHKNK